MDPIKKLPVNVPELIVKNIYRHKNNAHESALIASLKEELESAKPGEKRKFIIEDDLEYFSMHTVAALYGFRIYPETVFWREGGLGCVNYNLDNYYLVSEVEGFLYDVLYNLPDEWADLYEVLYGEEYYRPDEPNHRMRDLHEKIFPSTPFEKTVGLWLEK